MRQNLNQRIKDYYREKGIVIKGKDIPEIRDSLSHLGKAIFLYQQQKSN